jgi:transposase
MQRLGIDIPSATISDQILWASDLLEPIHRALIVEVTNAHLMQLDGTSLKVMHEEKGQGRHTFLGTLTGAIGDGTSAVYVYASSGHKRGQLDGDLGLEDLLLLRPGGLVLADASNHYDASFARAELVECGCNMHGRRGYSKALDAGNQRAAIALRAFKQLYDIEEDHRDSTAAERLAARQARSVPIYDVLMTWCRDVAEGASPSSLIAVAARYMIRHEVALRRFLSDGRIPIDNGAVERMHRRPAIVRKNMLFAGSHDGARRAAVMFSIFATAELLGLNPALYLADIFPKLARGIAIKTDLPDLMPAAWLAAHPQARVPVLNAVTTVAEFRVA